MTKACNLRYVATVVVEVKVPRTTLEIGVIQAPEVETLVTGYNRLVVTKEDMEGAREAQGHWYPIQQSSFPF